MWTSGISRLLLKAQSLSAPRMFNVSLPSAIDKSTNGRLFQLVGNHMALLLSAPCDQMKAGNLTEPPSTRGQERMLREAHFPAYHLRQFLVGFRLTPVEHSGRERPRDQSAYRQSVSHQVSVHAPCVERDRRLPEQFSAAVRSPSRPGRPSCPLHYP